jgi:hypothetical protein
VAYRKGESGNREGRKHGSRNRASLICDAIAADRVGKIVEAIAARAEQGDAECARLILQRAWPPRRAKVRFPMPELRSVNDLPAAVVALLQHVSDGSLAPGEAGEIATLLAALRQTHELVEMAADLKQIKQKLGLA